MTSITEVTGNLFIYLQLCGNIIFEPLYLIIISEDQTFCKFEILTVVLLKIYGFWVNSSHLPNDTAEHSRRHGSSRKPFVFKTHYHGTITYNACYRIY